MRNGWYTENYTANINQHISLGALYGCAGNSKISSASRKDYAEAAVVVLTGDGHENKIYELAGDESFTMYDLAAEISKQTGKQVIYKNLSEQEYAEVLKKVGLPDAMAVAFASVDSNIGEGALFDDNHELSRLIGHTTMPLSQEIKMAL